MPQLHGDHGELVQSLVVKVYVEDEENLLVLVLLKLTLVTETFFLRMNPVLDLWEEFVIIMNQNRFDHFFLKLCNNFAFNLRLV